jgi:hypothetical protein
MTIKMEKDSIITICLPNNRPTGIKAVRIVTSNNTTTLKSFKAS